MRYPIKEEYQDKIKNWFSNDSNRMFIISGYAGCGKTTLARQIPELLGVRNYRFLAPTGKASLLLGGGTIHSYLYKVHEDEDGELIFTKKSIDEFDESLLLIDEISMVGDDILEDLRELNIPMIGLGDPAQLPPVKGTNDILENPDILLTEVFRMDGGLLKLATDIREGNTRSLIKKEYDDVSFRNNMLNDITDVKDDDVIIVRYNKTRQEINSYYRRHIKKFENLLDIGEKIMILDNDRFGTGLMNGSIVHIVDIGYIDKRNHTVTLRVEDDLGRRFNIDANIRPITKVKGFVPKKTLGIDYAYAITCHKAQGSEYERVFVIKEGMHFDDWKKWYYTAVTRARKELFIYEGL